ncbi:MAG: hydrogenase maturation nickel metallochaperone HypA [Wenzhouxiangellaceae bacterium]|nr:hydrogenase maturation nickel metallochaperone HypA [Wenzhouxiangellaceae bacterium]
MHELAVCSELLDQVRATALARHAKSVGQITIVVGELSGVEPDLLRQAFSIARAGPLTAEAELLVQPAPIRIRCRECGNDNEAAANRLLCAKCGGFRVDLLAGDELLLASIELHGVPENPIEANQSREASHV